MIDIKYEGKPDLTEAYIQSLSTGELKTLIQKEKSWRVFFENMQFSVKLFMNSIYGATANKWFAGAHPNVAQSITSEGRATTKFAEHIINYYFHKLWHKDVKLHQKIGITGVSQIPEEIDIAFYGDTDSCDKDSIIPTNKGDIRIEDFYNEGLTDMGTTKKGHESVSSGRKVLNWDNKNQKFYYAKPKRIIRHKVRKRKFKVKTESGKEIFITEDHSLVFFRNGKPVKGTVYDKQPGDEILSRNENISFFYHQFESFEIEDCGWFEDEYVYDIEVDDETHTFIANDMLIHNSMFSRFDEIFVRCTLPPEKDKVQIIDEIYDFRLEDYFIKQFKRLFEERNGLENFLNFELEKISYSGIFLASKAYVMDVAKDGSIYFKRGKSFYPRGVKIVQSSTPPIARGFLKELAQYLLTENANQNDLFNRVKEMKAEFKSADINEISSGSKVNNYEKYVIDDKNKLILKKGIPIALRGAAIHNHLVRNSKFAGRYELITSGDFVKYYYAKSDRADRNVFSFNWKKHPLEVAPDVDYDFQFFKAVISPTNEFIKFLEGFSDINIEVKKITNLF